MSGRVGRVGYAPGVYDLFHVGHLNILKHARSECDYLIAGVVSDEMALLAKGRTPVMPLVERLEIVRSLRYVDEAVAEVLPEKIDTWKQVGFDIIFKGDDWRGTPKGDKLERDFAAVGVAGQVLPLHGPHVEHSAAASARYAACRSFLNLFSPCGCGIPSCPGRIVENETGAFLDAPAREG